MAGNALASCGLCLSGEYSNTCVYHLITLGQQSVLGLRASISGSISENGLMHATSLLTASSVRMMGLLFDRLQGCPDTTAYLGRHGGVRNTEARAEAQSGDRFFKWLIRSAD